METLEIPTVIESKSEYLTALNTVSGLAVKGAKRTREEDKLFRTWVLLIEEYEQRKRDRKLKKLPPHELLNFLMDENRLNQKSFEPGDSSISHVRHSEWQPSDLQCPSGFVRSTLSSQAVNFLGPGVARIEPPSRLKRLIEQCPFCSGSAARPRGSRSSPGAARHQAKLRRGLEPLEAPVHILLDLVGILNRQSQKLIVCFAGGDNPFQGVLYPRMARLPAQTHGEGKVAGAHKDDINAGRGGNRLDLFERPLFFH